MIFVSPEASKNQGRSTHTRQAADMRKIIAALITSLDGLIEGPNGELDWVDSWEDPFDLLPQIDTCILGRGMYPGYEQVPGARSWPTPAASALYRQSRDEGRDRLRTLRRQDTSYRGVQDIDHGRLDQHSGLYGTSKTFAR